MMSFLQPLLLLGLPLVVLPLVIHLLNRQRHRTIPWAAMMFLLDAKRTLRGMARLRQILIMAMRMLAIAALFFAASRPLASGWLGLTAGGRPDSAVILLDRSASMQQLNLQANQSKQATALEKLGQLVQTIGSTRTVLVESTQREPIVVEKPELLTRMAQAGPSSSSADIPGMLQAALDYLEANQAGRTDIWICSDLRRGDWQYDDSRWASLRQRLASLDGVRLYLLVYPELPDENVAVRVENVRRQPTDSGSELALDIHVWREGSGPSPSSIPLELVINGARTAIQVSLDGNRASLLNHTVPLDQSAVDGWGLVQLPHDTNPQDNVHYFTFADPPRFHTLIVSDDPASARLLQLAATAPMDAMRTYTATVLTPEQIGQVDWQEPVLVVWQAPPPEARAAQALEGYVQSGRPLVVFPAAGDLAGSAAEWFGMRWGAWVERPADRPLLVVNWRGDSDLLRHTQGGTPLPVGKLQILRYRGIAGRGTPLATLDGGDPLLLRATVDNRSIYFVTTLPQDRFSSLARDGVVFYALIQRALQEGADRHGRARQLPAGSPGAQAVSQWELLADLPQGIPSTEYPFQAGAYRAGDQLVALNRPEAEDATETLTSDEVDQLLAGLDYQQVTDRIGSRLELASEIWRAFLVMMAAALVSEAWLCLPQRSVP